MKFNKLDSVLSLGLRRIEMVRYSFVTLLIGSMCALMLTLSSMADPRTPVDLGAAGDFVILSKAGITDIYPTTVTGNIGVSPITGAAIHLTCTEVTGSVYAVDAAGPEPCSIEDPSRLTTAIGAMETAYVDAAGRVLPDSIEMGAGDISGRTIYPGLYKWGTGLQISSDVFLSGGPEDVWIFQIAEDLLVANGVMVHLLEGAIPSNIFWQVGGQVTLGTTSHFEGVILSETAINMQTGASINGKLFAKTGVTLQMSAITNPTAMFIETNSFPTVFKLAQNYPNPFNPTTTIQYSLAEEGMVSLKVYDVMGKEVAVLVNGFQEIGDHTVLFGTDFDLPNGLYLYRLEIGTFASVKKLILIK